MVVEAKAKTKRTRRTKAEIQEKFENLIQEESDTRASADAKLQAMLKIQDREIVESLKDISSEEVVKKFATLNIDISKTLKTLSDNIVHEVNFLTNLRHAIEVEKDEFQRIHKIDLAQCALDQMIDEYHQQKEELNSEIENTRYEWEQEQTAKEQENKEIEEQLAKSRKRETEEYEYKKNLERKKAQDKYEEEIRLKDKESKDKQEALQKSWQTREEALKQQEDELFNLRKEVKTFPERLQKDIAREVDLAIKQTEQKYAQEILLSKKDGEAERRIAELKIKTLEDQVTKLNAQMNALQHQLDEAKKQVQDIAVRAIEGASGAKTLAHVNQIAMEQAKGRPNPAK